MQGKKHRPEQIIKNLREAEMMLAAGKMIGQIAQPLLILPPKPSPPPEC